MFHSRINSRLADQARRDYWAHKQAQADADAIADKARTQALVSDWASRFQAARNATCEGQKNFRGVK